MAKLTLPHPCPVWLQAIKQGFQKYLWEKGQKAPTSTTFTCILCSSSPAHAELGKVCRGAAYNQLLTQGCEAPPVIYSIHPPDAFLPFLQANKSKKAKPRMQSLVQLKTSSESDELKRGWSWEDIHPSRHPCCAAAHKLSGFKETGEVKQLQTALAFFYGSVDFSNPRAGCLPRCPVL